MPALLHIPAKTTTCERHVSEFIEIDGPMVKAKKHPHESGPEMIVFSPFKPEIRSEAAINTLIHTARALLGPETRITRINLEPDQREERALLEHMGFVLDGTEYGIEVKSLSLALRDKGTDLDGFKICAMDYDRDIDDIVKLERSVHSADPSSRVNFETEQAVCGMKNYYRKTCEEQGVYLLRHNAKIRGVIGFKPDKERTEAVHISSVSIDLGFQGRGLFFPFLFESLRQSRFAESKVITGVTTTARLIKAAKRYGVGVLGLSFVGKPDP